MDGWRKVLVGLLLLLIGSAAGYAVALRWGLGRYQIAGGLGGSVVRLDTSTGEMRAFHIYSATMEEFAAWPPPKK
jgi:hypothetical protein